jgi:hypothetical protein
LKRVKGVKGKKKKNIQKLDYKTVISLSGDDDNVDKQDQLIHVKEEDGL